MKSIHVKLRSLVYERVWNQVYKQTHFVINCKIYKAIWITVREKSSIQFKFRLEVDNEIN